MEYGILGPPRVVGPGGTVHVAGHRQRTVLAVLLVNRGRVVPRADLIDAVWPERPPATARRQVSNLVSALRQQLVEAGARPPAIVGESPGYRIRPAAGELDADVFAERVALARELAEDGQPVAAVEALRSALGLWRGPALMGVSGPGVDAAAAGLNEQRLVAVELRIDLELGLGRHDPLVGELTELVGVHPLRERFVGQLMTALHAAGHQAEALRAYDRLRTRLGDELGADPGAPLRALHTALLRDEPIMTASRPPGRAEAAQIRPAQLPRDVVGFTGRARELKHLDELIPAGIDDIAAGVAIATVTGMAGVGKTALAVHWGHRVRDRFPDGQLYVDLRGFAIDAPVRPIEALTHFLRSLGAVPELITTDIQTAAAHYRSLLAGRRMLVVLDNAADAEQVRPLLPGSPGCLALVTSRERLSGLVALDGARRLTLDVLAPDEAQLLLAEILGPDRVRNDPAATAELASVCAYLPLSLRIAAAGLIGRPAPDIAGHAAAIRDGQGMAALEIQGDEQASVRRAFDLSYRAQPAQTRRLFRLLGVAPGPDCTAEAAAALVGTATSEAGGHLDRLAAAHLVQELASGRYTFHDLLLRYAVDRARDEDTDQERTAALRRLTGWRLRRCDAAAQVLYPQKMRLPVPVTDEPESTGGPEPTGFGDYSGALAWLDAERANLVATIRHAAAYGPRSAAWLLADTLRGYFWLGMHTLDWAEAAEAGLTAAEADGDARAQAAILLSLADTEDRRNRRRHAMDFYRRALTLSRRAEWADGQLAAYCKLGVMYRETGRLRQAIDHLDRALALCIGKQPAYREAVILGCLGRAYMERGELATADEHYRRALRLFTDGGSRQGQAAAFDALGQLRCAQGRLDDAMEHLDRALILEREVGDRGTEVRTLCTLAAVHRDAGRLGPADEVARAATALAEELRDRRLETDALNVLGTLRHRTGRHADAADCHRRALDLTRATGYRYVEVEALLGLAAEYGCLGRRDEATEQARRAATLAGRAGFGVLADRARAILGGLLSGSVAAAPDRHPATPG